MISLINYMCEGASVRNKKLSLSAGSQKEVPEMFKWNEKTQKYDAEGDVDIPRTLVRAGRLSVSLGRVEGNFTATKLGLTSLEGFPEFVGGNCDCSRNRLTNLKGAPREVNGNFDCQYNSLKSIEGAPEIVRGDLKVDYNNFPYDDENFYNHLPDVIGGNIFADDYFDAEYAKDFYETK